MLAGRDRLSPAERATLSRAIVERFWSLPEVANIGSIQCFLSTKSEVETGTVIDTARRRGLLVAVPITDVEAHRLTLSEFSSLDALVPGPFGILEPRRGARTPVPVDQVDAFVVPGIAFDASGNRLGWGAGYYDRLLADRRPEAPVIALAYECQIVRAIPPEGHDIAVSVIVTEQRVIRTGRDRRESSSGARSSIGNRSLPS